MPEPGVVPDVEIRQQVVDHQLIVDLVVRLPRHRQGLDNERESHAGSGSEPPQGTHGSQTLSSHEATEGYLPTEGELHVGRGRDGRGVQRSWHLRAHEHQFKRLQAGAFVQPQVRPLVASRKRGRAHHTVSGQRTASSAQFRRGSMASARAPTMQMRTGASPESYTRCESATG